jgi:hypothetical protein
MEIIEMKNNSNKTHWIGSVIKMERIVGRIRELQDKSGKFIQFMQQDIRTKLLENSV